MTAIRDKLAQLLGERDSESLADSFADVIEERINFRGTADDYFASLLRLPRPLLELYAALIFNSRVRADGLADVVPLYDHPEFVNALRQGLEMVGHEALYAIIDRARQRLRDPAAAILQSDAPNVAIWDIQREYFARNKELMAGVGEYLQREHACVLAAASELD